MLHNEEERLLLIKHSVGAVYLANGSDKAFPVLKLVLQKWEWLRLLDKTVSRPFAYLISIGGEARKLDIHAALPLGSGVHVPGVKVSTKVVPPSGESAAPISPPQTPQPATQRLLGF